MTISLSLPELTELKPRITVIGVGGAGGNAVNNMIRASLQGVDFIAANTDAQALLHSTATRRIQLGAHLTQGLGAGARPDVGRAAAEESLAEIMEHIAGSHMVFITAGMGGGTGTGAAPIIAEAIREKGILTVGVVTKPFQFEGAKRMRLAEEGITQLQKFVDTLIIIPNQNLFRVATEKTTIADAFVMADEVLHSGVRGVTDLMIMPGLVNLDFADVRTVMSEMGKAMMGTGEAEGENRALDAAEAAISNPLLDEVSMRGAKGVLINITGGMDLTLFEVDEAANRIRAEVDADANILVGSALDDSLNGRMRVSVVATGIDSGVAALDLRLSAGQRTTTLDKASLVERAMASITTVAPVSESAAARIEVAVAEDIADDLFIAPEPMEFSRPALEPTTEADSFAEAAFANGPASEKKAPSWFERMTGRNRRSAEAEEGPDLFRSEAAEPRVTVTVERREPAVAAAPSLGRLAAGDRISAGRPKLDDQLDIPTFLRRQAN